MAQLLLVLLRRKPWPSPLRTGESERQDGRTGEVRAGSPSIAACAQAHSLHSKPAPRKAEKLVLC